MEEKERKKTKKRVIASRPPKFDFAGFAIKTGCIVGGCIAASHLSKFVEKKDEKGSDLLGLSGMESKIATSGLVTAAGILASVFIPNRYVKDVALGVTIAGASGLINKVSGKDVVSLGAIEAEKAEEKERPMILPDISGISGAFAGTMYHVSDAVKQSDTVQKSYYDLSGVSDIAEEKDLSHLVA